MASALAVVHSELTFETSTDVRNTAAFGGIADISQRLLNNRDL
jgi:hypothetical protein